MLLLIVLRRILYRILSLYDILDQCGSSPYFSAVVSIEGVHVISGQGPLVTLSVQQILDCSGSFGNEGCDGGWMNESLAYVISVGGIETNETYPYTGVGGNCTFSASNIAATIDSLVNVEPGDETALTEALAQVPVACAVAVTNNFFVRGSICIVTFTPF